MTPALQGDPEQAAQIRARLRLIGDIDELPERQRGALLMRELSGLGFEEIAAALGTTEAVARQAIHEARSNLRQVDRGRQTACSRITRALSDGDRRILRGREIRAHLRDCPGCSAFEAAIAGRRSDLAALGPLPPAASAGLLGGLLGGGHGATGAAGPAGALGAGAGKTLAASVLLKSTATVVAVAALGAGAADAGALIHLGLPDQGGDRPATSASVPAAGPSVPATGRVRAAPTGPRAGEGAGRRRRRAREGATAPRPYRARPPGVGRAAPGDGAEVAEPDPNPVVASRGQGPVPAGRTPRPVAGAPGHAAADPPPDAPLGPPPAGPSPTTRPSGNRPAAPAAPAPYPPPAPGAAAGPTGNPPAVPAEPAPSPTPAPAPGAGGAGPSPTPPTAAAPHDIRPDGAGAP